MLSLLSFSLDSIRVRGHTDNVGRANLILILSAYRVRVVQAYMNKHRFPLGHIYISRSGSNAPVAMNDTKENKSKNRRVEIQLVQKIQENQTEV